MTLPPSHAAPTSSAFDEALAGWLDAARVGGFPMPTRADRWQPLRAGVLNLWEFAAAEYWYADGWVQLTGRNETGKSSLMALTTLIPWLADTSSTNIDTLGRSGKKFRYYVEPTGNDGDRRTSAGSTNRGWLWVEYGRLQAGEPQFFTVLLFAEARAAARDVVLTWCTADGNRVRDTLDLAPGQAVATPKELAPGLSAHPNAAAYKQEVADRLLGSTVERLEAAGKMLRTTRTPKLGAELHVSFVERQLRSALPELDRSEVEALAAGWDQLDQLGADLEATSQAVEAVERFRKGAWLPWVKAELRRRADAAARARTEFDRVTRDERDSHEEVDRLTRDQVDIAAASSKASATADAAALARESLQSSARFQDAVTRIENLNHRKEAASRLRELATKREKEAERARTEREAAEAEVGGAESQAEAARSACERTQDRLATAAAEAGVVLPSGEVDLPLAERRLDERRASVKRARELLRDADQRERNAGGAEESAASARDRARSDREGAEAAWREAESLRDGLVFGVAGWASQLAPAVSTETVDGWISGLPVGVTDGQGAGTPLHDAIRRDWFDPARNVQDLHRADAARRAEEATATANDLARRIAEIADAPSLSFAPPLSWARRERPDPSQDGAPLWTLVDPREGVAEHDLAHIEAALAAQGLLDAWVTPDGVFRPERDGVDVVWAAGTAGESGDEEAGRPRLHDLLQPADGAGALTASVAAALGGVRLLAGHEQLPSAGLAVGRDGRWRAGTLAGLAAPRHDGAEWLGESARAAQRRRTIAELERDRQAALADAERAASDVEKAVVALKALATTFERAPTDAGLRAALLVAAERDKVAEASAAEAERRAAQAAEQRALADRATAALTGYCTERGLPRDDDGLHEVFDAVGRAVRIVDRVRSDRGVAHSAYAALTASRERLAGRDKDQARAEQESGESARQSAAVEASVATLEAAMDADDSGIVAELERLKAAEVSARRAKENADGLLRAVGEQLGKAGGTLEGVVARRERATVERDAVFAAFRVLVDRGLVAEAGLDLPDVHASSVERVRDQVSAIRRLVEPLRWPEDPVAQEKEGRRLHGLLVDKVHDVRAELETHGRSMQLVTDDEGLPRVEVQVDASGVPAGPREAAMRLAQIHTELGAHYTARVQETLNELLGSTFLEHLRGRIGQTDALIRDINATLAQHPLAESRTRLRIVLEPSDPQNRIMLEAMRGSALMNREAEEHVREHLKSRVESAKRAAASAGEADWRDRLVETLDYRGWFEVHLRRKIGQLGSWGPLTSQNFAEMSGGARAVMLMLPLVATLAAHYETMEGAPRPIWLDEAFDGLDSANRATVMALFRDFDLDVLLAGPNRLVNVSTVPAAAIYQVVRSPAPLPGADLTLELWAGGDLTLVDLPATLPVGRPSGEAVAADQEALL